MPLALWCRLYSTDNFSSFVFLFSVGKCLIYTHIHTLPQALSRRLDPKIVWPSFVLMLLSAFVQCFYGYAFYLCSLFFQCDFIHSCFFFLLLLANNFLLQAFSLLFHVNIDYIVCTKKKAIVRANMRLPSLNECVTRYVCVKLLTISVVIVIVGGCWFA